LRIVDNVTHTLIGLITGEAVVNHARPSEHGLAAPVRRTLLVAVAVIGSNSPDLDLLLSTRGSEPANLNYMLWHRGYTHTVLGCLALALILYGCAEAWLYLRRLKPSRRDRALLLGTALFTTALHLVMDYLNSYGVHPFWPAENRWSYGDSVFIVEPLYWAAAAPLFFLLRSRFSRVLFGLALISAVAVGAATSFLSAASCAVLALSTVLLIALGARISAPRAARISVALGLALTLLLVSAGRSAAHRAQALAHAAFPEDRLLDHVLSPLPVNPFCWDLWLLETRGDRYLARHAILAIAPRALPAQECHVFPREQHSAPLTRVSAPDSAGVRWLDEFSMSTTELKLNVDANCNAAAFMLFARAPFLARTDSGEAERARILGDLRFDRGGESSGFEIPLGQDVAHTHALPRDCGRAAPWAAPRADLLDQSAE
jgi:inner membrane protein